MNRRILVSLFAAAGTLLAEIPIIIEEQAGRNWNAELVHWDIPDETKSWRIVDENNKPVQSQLYRQKAAVRTPLEGPGIYALVDLPAHRKLKWKIVEAKKQENQKTEKSLVEIVESADVFVLSSGLLEARISTKARQNGQKIPSLIQGLRLPGGKWMGAGTISAKGKLLERKTSITARGPLFAEVEVNDTWSDGRHYLCRIRLVAKQTVVHVTESFGLGTESHSEFVFAPIPSHDTVHGIFQSLPGHLKAPGESALSQKIETEQIIARIHAWRSYKSSNLDAAWYASYSKETANPVFGFITTFPQVWTRPGGHPHDSEWYKVGAAPIEVSIRPDRSQVFRLPLEKGTRSYCLYFASGEDFRSEKPNGIIAAKRRFGETPLQRSKDWILKWPHQTTHPHLFFNKDDVPRLRKNLPKFPKLAEAFAPGTKREKIEFLEDLTCRYLASGDEKIVREILKSDAPPPKVQMHAHTAGLLPELRLRVHGFLDGNGICPPSFNNLMWIADHLLFRVMSADVVMGSSSITGDERETLQRLLAVIAYQMESYEMMPPKKNNFQLGMPNMIAPYYAVLGMIGALLPDHPHSRRWMERCHRELRDNLYWLSRPDGTWAETYYYQERTMRGFVPAAIALARKGMPNLLKDPRAQAVLRMEIATLTPIDPRQNARCFPSIGDGTYYVPKPSLFWAAKNVATFNPDLAAELVWAWQQQGRPVGWLFNKLHPCTWFLGDPDAPARAPRLTSQVMDGAGLILRSRYNQACESYLHLRAATFATSHFEDDQLSFHWYAKGAPMCLDWGYYGNRETRPVDMHNRTVLGKTKKYRGEVVEKFFLPRLDYVHVRDTSQNTRVRRLLFVRGDKPTDPEYMILRDTISEAGRWNLWTFANSVEMKLAGKDKPDEEDKENEEDEKDKEFDDEKLLNELAKKSEVKTDSLTRLRKPTLPNSHGEWVKPFDVPVLDSTVFFTTRFGVDLRVKWLTPVDRIEMGAYQYHPLSHGEHQKLIRLHKKDAGDFLSVLYPSIHQKEPNADIQPWGKGGVKITRTDGFKHYAWISAPVWRENSTADLKMNFSFKGTKVSGSAFLIAETPGGRKEICLIGAQLKFGRIAIRCSKRGAIALAIGPDKIDGVSEGPERRIDIALPSKKGKVVVQAGGKPVQISIKRGKFTFEVPSGIQKISLQLR